MLRTFVVCSVVLCMCMSMASASLINPADQINNDNNALGGNAAARAFNKTSTIEVGNTLMSKFSQNANILGGVDDMKGSDVDPAAFDDLSLQYNTQVMNMGWLGVAYEKDTSVRRSVKMSVNKDVVPEGGAYTYTYLTGTEVLALSYGMDMTKDLSVGVELANNRYFTLARGVADSKYRTNVNRTASEGELYYTSMPYTSVAVGGIYKLSNMAILTGGYKTFNERNMSGKGADNGPAGSGKYDCQYNEAINPELSLGYVQKVNNALSLGGTMRMYLGKEYTELRSDGPQTETLINKVGYTAYTMNGEYMLANDLGFQGYFGWAKDANRAIYDDAREATPVDTTEMGVSVMKTFGVHSVTGGLARTNRFEKDAFDANTGKVTDETKVYANYAYAF